MLNCEACGKQYDIEVESQLCECGEPLILEYFSGDIKEDDEGWNRYDDLLPLKIDNELSLGEGLTPLSRAKKLSKELGVNLLLKNETMNPTWSFKDRGTVFSVQRAIDLDKTKIGTVSTGNMAASVSAYGARNEAEALVLVPSTISDKKIFQIQSYGPTIVKVKGDYGDLYYDSFELDLDIYFTNSNSPYRIEGYKTIAFEIYEKIEPDYLVVPTSSGGLFRGITKGLVELKISGYIQELPTLVSVQAEGCSPIYEAYKNDGNEIKHWSEPETVASAIANPLPPGGNDVLRKLERFEGICERVSDDEILEAQEEIAQEGIYPQPSSAVGVAALKNLREKGTIEKGADVVSIITGSGLKSRSKTLTKNTIQCDLGELETCLQNFFRL